MLKGAGIAGLVVLVVVTVGACAIPDGPATET